MILKAGDRAMKTVQDLLQAIEQAKEKDLVLEILRDGKKQKITVKPAKRPAEGVFVLQLEEGKGEKSSSGAKVRQLRGGGLQVIIGEANEGAEGKAAVRSLEAARKELEKTLATAHAKAGERIKRQHELAEKVWQAYQKMQALGENKKGEAHELWEQIENLERQLRQTFEPAGGALRPVAPGAPLNRVPNPAPGAPLNLSNGWIQIVPGGQLAPGQSAPGQPLPGGTVIVGERRQVASLQELRAQVEQLRSLGEGNTSVPNTLQELRAQVEQLRRDVEELKAQSKKR